MTGWSDWQAYDRAFRSPYVDWEVALLDRLGRLDQMTMIPVPPLLVGSERGGAAQPGAREVFPVPGDVANPDPEANLPADGEIEAADPADLSVLDPALAATTVVVGVIDIDIGFGHRRFRTRDGKTRVLGSWQQGAPWRAETRPGLPFGEELFADGIDALLAAHTLDGPTGGLDHDGFYSRLGLISYDRVEGMGALAVRAAHGTHVLGLAAGQDAQDDPEGFSDNVRLLVVNLPPAAFFGEGGAFLDYYLSYGLQWIVKTHAAIVAASRAGAGDGAEAGAGAAVDPPLFVNISFGKQAGAADPWQASPGLALAAPPGAPEPVVLVPAGNDNLERCHAQFALGDEEQSLAWRVQPDDDTSNFLEIWVLPEYRAGAAGGPPAVPLPLEIDLELPDGTRAGYGAPAHGVVRELTGGLGRIYCDWVYSEHRAAYRLRYLVCLSPDRLMVPDDPACRGAPAGRYRLHLKNCAVHKRLDVSARIQTDEATLPSARHARRAYFEDPDYVMFEPSGRLADTYPYPGGPRPESFDTDSPIRRHGTMNAYAAHEQVVVVAGFRLTDGRPAPFSATGLGLPDSRWGRVGPTAAFPSDDGAAHFGLLSDGSRDGSAMAMQGTSFACAAATRFVTEAAVAALVQGRTPVLPDALTTGAPDAGWLSPTVPVAKAGWGRVPFQPARPVDRL